MFLKTVRIKRFAKHAIVPFVQSNAVVVDTTGDVDLPMQLAVSLSLIQLKTIRLQDSHLTFAVMFFGFLHTA